MTLISEKLLRLTELRKRRPEYAEIYDFYTGLCQFLEVKDATWLSCNPDLSTWEVRRQAGFPLLSSSAMQIALPEAKLFVGRLIDSLIELGQQGTRS